MWGKMRSTDLSQQAENRIPNPHFQFIHFSKLHCFTGVLQCGRGHANEGAWSEEGRGTQVGPQPQVRVGRAETAVLSPLSMRRATGTAFMKGRLAMLYQKFKNMCDL